MPYTILQGGKGADTLTAGQGNHMIYGDDTLHGGRSNDRLIGGLDGGFASLDIRERTDGHRVDIHYGNGDVIALCDVDIADIDESDFKFVDDGDDEGLQVVSPENEEEPALQKAAGETTKDCQNGDTQTGNAMTMRCSTEAGATTRW